MKQGRGVPHWRYITDITKVLLKDPPPLCLQEMSTLTIAHTDIDIVTHDR